MAVMVFRSTDTGAPSFDWTTGLLHTLLQKCLVTGYNPSTISSMTRVGTTVTVVTSAAHNLAPSIQSFRYINILGANQTEYNGTWKITNFVNTTTFTFEIATTPVTPATGGSIVVSVAHAGWTMPFTGTNQAAFKQPAGSNGFYINVYDGGSNANNTVRMYETMSAIATGTNPSGIVNMYKDQNPATSWILITNGKFIYFLHSTNSYGFNGFCFGDFPSNSINSDIYNTFLMGGDGGSTNSQWNNVASTNKHIMRDVGQTGNYINTYVIPDGVQPTSTIGIGNMQYPDIVRGALVVSPIYLITGSGKRGQLPGILSPSHTTRVFADLDLIVGAGDYLGKTYLCKYLSTTGNSYALFEISDTW